MLDGVDPLGQYRPYCDVCGDKLANSALRLEQARRLALGHARRYHHNVRIEPWDSFQLIETVTPDDSAPFFGQVPDEPHAVGDRPPPHQAADIPRMGCGCFLCANARSQRR